MNILSDRGKFPIISNDPLVVIPLPDLISRRKIFLVYQTRTYRLEILDDCTERPFSSALWLEGRSIR